jgi:serine/threonine-protein kinase
VSDEDAVTQAETRPTRSSEAPTAVETAGATGTQETSATSSTSGTSGTSATKAESPEIVLRRLEIEQTRNISVTGMVFNAVALAAGPILGGDASASTIFMVSAAVALLNNGYRFFISTEERYRERHLYLFIAISALTNSGIAYYLGVFGPVLVIFIIDQYNACLYYSRRIALATLIAGCAPAVCIGGAYALELTRDPGLITAVSTPPAGLTLFIGIFVLLMIAIYTQTLKTRQVTETSLQELDEVVRLAARREALFLEARQDLEQALRAGGLGRFSGQVLGSFELGAIIGRGGMGEVYEATHTETSEPAAVKMLLPEVLSRPDFVRRFLREVRIAASLSSPHVVAVLAVGDESAPLPYLAMERLHGESLAQILRRERRLEEAEVIDLVQQVAEGIETANEAGIVHRDLKPQNVFRTSDGVWKILDFGISKLADGVTLTGGEVLGTPQYMAPEQVDGEVDHRTDIYGLAALTYRALTGRQPFVGSDFAAVVLDVVTKMPLRPTDLATSAHHHVDLALAIGLAKEPDDRYESAKELADAVEDALRGRLGRDLRVRARALLKRMPWRREVIEAGQIA